jgi:hypothetical protein
VGILGHLTVSNQFHTRRRFRCVIACEESRSLRSRRRRDHALEIPGAWAYAVCARSRTRTKVVCGCGKSEDPSHFEDYTRKIARGKPLGTSLGDGNCQCSKVLLQSQGASQGERMASSNLIFFGAKTRRVALDVRFLLESGF